MNTSRILFLDIDGVLNNKMSGTFYSINHSEKYAIDEENWKNLQKFLDSFPDIKIVIHSGWIKHKDDPNYEWDMGYPEKNVRIKSLLPEVIRRLGDRYLDCVPYLKGQPKSARIEKWLSDRDLLDKPAKCQCIVIDDDHSEYHGLEELSDKHSNIGVLFTDSEVGFDYSTLISLCSISDRFLQ